MELRHLRYFITVAEELHFSRAAQRLGMSQPPLSQQIRSLERELGVELFRRDPQGISLTDAGQVLWQEANRLVHDADALVQLADAIKRGQEGVVRIGAVGTAVLGVLPALIRQALRDMPRVSFHLLDIETGDQAVAFLEHRIDVGIIRPPIGQAEVDYVPLLHEPLIAAVCVDHPLAGETSVAAERLAGEDFVLFPRRLGQGLFDSVVSVCTEAGFQPHIRHETERMQTIIGMIASGAGVSIVPGCVANLAVPGVRYLTLAGTTVTSELGVCVLKGAAPQVRRFLAVATAFAADLVAELPDPNPLNCGDTPHD
ncbi:LysR family transcriptional regulator [Micromonospora sp. NPDC005113]